MTQIGSDVYRQIPSLTAAKILIIYTIHNDMDSIEKLLPAFTETEPPLPKFLRNIAK